MRHISKAALTLAAFVLLFVPATGSAGTALVEVRVEGTTETLDPGTWYVTGNERVKRAKPGDNCRKRPGSTAFAGPTALTSIASAAGASRDLSPVRYRPTDFGPQLCQIGDLRSFGHFPGDSGGFLYWVDFVSGFSSPDVAPVARGQRVLWHYSTFGSQPVNDGMALEIRGVPARDTDGEFVVDVVAHNFDGTPIPVSDADLTGVASATPLGGGEYAVTVADGRSTIKAERGSDVRSNGLTVCVRAKLSSCPKAHGRKIIGSSRADKLEGTKGWDRIDSGGGSDVIDLRAGGRDKAVCGGGKDTVLVRKADRDDRIAKSCERTKRS